MISLTSFLGACYSDSIHTMHKTPSRHIEISSDFTSQQQFLIKIALEEWKTKTGVFTYDLNVLNNIDPNEIKDDTTKIYPVDPNILIAINKDGMTSGRYANVEYFTVIVSPILKDDEFVKTIIHELGHTFHLGHYYGLNQSVMYSYFQRDVGLSCTDIQNFCNIWDCNTTCKDIPNQVYFQLNDGNNFLKNKSIVDLSNDFEN